MPQLELFVEATLLAVAVVAALLVLVWRSRLGGRSMGVVAGLAVVALTARAVVWGAETARWSESVTGLVKSVPHVGLDGEGFVTSDACQSCHPSQFDSWHHSFHRTMTQRAVPEAVVGDFDEVTLTNRGRSYRLERRGDEFWVRMVNPDWEHELLDREVDPSSVADPPVVEKRVVMTTGSHHQQTYWVASDRDRRLMNLPFIWLIEDQRWAPREEVFLRPPHWGRMFSKWNDNCIECHSVAGEPALDKATGLFDTRVAELGISCEGCHGPAREHIRANTNPTRRYAQHFSDDRDETVVRPDHLAAVRSSQVCGQCHGLNIFKGDVLEAGGRYRAGGDLSDYRMFLRTAGRNLTAPEERDWSRLQRHIGRQTETFLEERLWPDGMVRVSGREHNAMIESECYRTGELSCLSCHSMHDYEDRNDQLTAGMDGNGACFQCHAEYEERLDEHTHHPPQSSGSVCYNCHMPHTTYGLLKAIRSHLIDSPTVASSLETGRPNACNLCHLDRTLDWAAGYLGEWYGQQPAPELSDDERNVAGSLLRALSGDANQRALIAWHMGWEPARAASGETWLAPTLAHLLNDPYSAVRYIAHRSLRKVSGFEDFPYDFVGGAEHAADGRDRALTRWARAHGAGGSNIRPELLFRPDGRLNADEYTRLSALRDDRAVDLRE